MGAHSVPYIQNDLAWAFEIVSNHGVVVLHAGTPAPIADIQRDYDLAMIGDRMALVLGQKDSK